jgi:prepilin-type N-terminal cleavage/methylation domain-containing protein
MTGCLVLAVFGRVGGEVMAALENVNRLASCLLNKDLFATESPPRRQNKQTNRNHTTMLRKLNTKHAGFTLVEIMIVVAIIALLAAIAVPNFLRSRKRSQATQVLEDLRILDSAVDQYAIENNKNSATTPTWADVQSYIKTGSRLYASGQKDILGNTLKINAIDTAPQVNSATYNALSDVAPASFWSPFNY